MTELFADSEAERLPLPDAELLLWRQVDLGEDRAALFERLAGQIDWRQEEVTVYGKRYAQPRLCAWYGDHAYTYSGTTLQPLPWRPDLLRIKHRIEGLTRARFNSVLLNYYRDGSDSMGMHSDDERELGARPVIASLSLGATRDFIFKHRFRKDLATVKLALQDGSLLLMSGDTQRCWRHGINKVRRDCGPRINLTFRRVLSAEDLNRG